MREIPLLLLPKTCSPPCFGSTERCFRDAMHQKEDEAYIYRFLMAKSHSRTRSLYYKL